MSREQLPLPTEPEGSTFHPLEVTCPHVWTVEEIERIRTMDEAFTRRMREAHGDDWNRGRPIRDLPEPGTVCGDDLGLAEPVMEYYRVDGWVPGWQGEPALQVGKQINSEGTGESYVYCMQWGHEFDTPDGGIEWA